jgi:glycerophosphoryl diester phosphodiesterase
MSLYTSWLTKTPIAHRGLHNAALPELSLGAFQNAIDHGYPIEIDVRGIDDGTLIVFHDDKISRMTGVDGYACNLTKDDLARIRLGGTAYGIPTLDEVLALVHGQVPLLIEIKNAGTVGGLEKKLLERLLAYDGEYAVQSFNPYSLGYFADNANHILRGQLSAKVDKASGLSRIKRTALTRMWLNRKVSRPDFISYNAAELPNRFVSKQKLPTLAWTVRSVAEQEAVAAHCDNIIFELFTPVEKKK